MEGTVTVLGIKIIYLENGVEWRKSYFCIQQWKSRLILWWQEESAVVTFSDCLLATSDQVLHCITLHYRSHHIPSHFHSLHTKNHSSTTPYLVLLQIQIPLPKRAKTPVKTVTMIAAPISSHLISSHHHEKGGTHPARNLGRRIPFQFFSGREGRKRSYIAKESNNVPDLHFYCKASISSLYNILSSIKRP